MTGRAPDVYEPSCDGSTPPGSIHMMRIMDTSGSSGAQERYDRMLLLGARTVFWVIPSYLLVSLLFKRQESHVYWSLGIAWLLASLGLVAMKRGRTRIARYFVLLTMVEAVSVLVLAGGRSRVT